MIPKYKSAKFSPLSMEEIMAVPMAKQKQHDELQSAMDELDLIQSQYLSADAESSEGIMEGIKEMTSGYADELMSQGVDRGLINKMKTLKKRVAHEQSAQGNLGKAKSAYEAYQEDRENTMKRTDISQAQKERGLALSMQRYEQSGGAGAGASYQAYVNAAAQDIGKLASSIVNDMEPETIALYAGLDYDKNTNKYKSDKYQYDRLPEDKIFEAVKNGLLANDEAMGYIRELEELGISGGVENYIDNIALETAQNMKQGGIGSDEERVYRDIINSENDMRNDIQYSTVTLMNTGEQMEMNDKLIVDEDRLATSFNEDESALDATAYQEYFKSEYGYEDPNDGWIRVKSDYTTGDGGASIIRNKMMKDDPEHYKFEDGFAYEKTPFWKNWEEEQKPILEVRDTINTLRKGKYSAKYSDLSDKEIYQSIISGRENATVVKYQVTQPTNKTSKEAFDQTSARISGDQNNQGEWSTRSLKVLGEDGTILSAKGLAEKLGMTQGALEQAFKISKAKGHAFGDNDLPGGMVFQIDTSLVLSGSKWVSGGEDTIGSGGQFVTVVVGGDEQTKQQWGDLSKLNNNLRSNTLHSKEKTSYYDTNGELQAVEKHYVNLWDPGAGTWRQSVITTDVDMTEEEAMNLEPWIGNNGKWDGETYTSEGHIFTADMVEVQSKAQIIDSNANRLNEAYKKQING